MRVLVAYLRPNGWTDLAELFLLAPSWSRDGFIQKKFRIRDPVFPKIRKKLILAGNYNLFLQKFSNFHVVNRLNNSANIE